jgi:hypothetical protein
MANRQGHTMRLTSATTSFSLLALAAALGLAAPAQAGCTPNVNSDATYSTCIGTDALENNATSGVELGFFNTAMGFNALRTNTTGFENTAIGESALYFSETGIRNTASGSLALANNKMGSNNTASGGSALLSNVSGSNNTASGVSALYSNETGSNNIALGYQAGYNTTGSNNISIGNSGVGGESSAIRIGTQGIQTKAFMAGISGVALSGGQAVVVKSDGQLGVAPAIPGTSNVALGGSALISNTTGNNNTAGGVSALSFNTTGSNNTASGVNALKSNTTGGSNTASGVSALMTNTTGGKNVAVGYEAAKAQTTGSSNTAVGYQAGLAWTTGKNNIAIGAGAGKNQTTGSDNIIIGAAGASGDKAIIRIGTKGTQTKAFMAGIRDVNVTGGQTVLVNKDGQLGVASSSRRYKQDIQPMGDASDRLMQLQPVTFHYRQADENGERPLQYGLIAEDVAEVMPALAIYNDAGAPESVAYQMLPTLLLNEYQKQARELADVKAELAALKLAVSRLAAAPSATQLASGN